MPRGVRTIMRGLHGAHKRDGYIKTRAPTVTAGSRVEGRLSKMIVTSKSILKQQHIVKELLLQGFHTRFKFLCYSKINNLRYA